MELEIHCTTKGCNFSVILNWPQEDYYGITIPFPRIDGENPLSTHHDRTRPKISEEYRGQVSGHGDFEAVFNGKSLTIRAPHGGRHTHAVIDNDESELVEIFA